MCNGQNLNYKKKNIRIFFHRVLNSDRYKIVTTDKAPFYHTTLKQKIWSEKKQEKPKFAKGSGV